ncbi:S-adenosyl-l-methionine hydroxide adenosyltransferase family protein [Aquibacillus koreensis]|uniref:S-adenosyl-l-methionine hydroxide adenosyltransferase family protein n=1 Tax=Aquibacillus koreensis TaxID=279446 RepID=A0A9X3WHX2_9BACI|nr:S-adenosyl-l-methionine hydroxide adenosyltransferase family protein [Aquibacillus koreensis]MCT2537477.1 S-adenosyl-l-methionine hydroxide adenosyltransferase family protein [Aquibacillus koreensis]MDC3418923.1 S-adenosyl-l-methionine hydroxide adenosyltransferase family protein [Aquibacillus koreensis]
MTNALVLQSDFGVSDGAVNAMKGVAYSVENTISIFDLTHDIPVFNVWEASYRLIQTVNYWPKETVFVSVVDPGVGTDRESVVVKTLSDQYIVTPNNGTLTHIAKEIGIKEIREIDEEVNRLPHSGASHTFHGRDIYAYTGARLVAGVIEFKQVGPNLPISSIKMLPIIQAGVQDDTLIGMVDILDIRFGNLWTNLSRKDLEGMDIRYGDMLSIVIKRENKVVYEGTMLYGRSFADSNVGHPLVYVNSLDNLGVALNQESFANKYRIESGVDWKIIIKKVNTNMK